jgi:hypothetical protein
MKILNNKKGGTLKNMVKLRCSPKDKNTEQINDFTCYSDKSLLELRDLWNIRHPDKKITSNNTKQIWDLLSEYMKGICNKESCWLKQNFVSSNKSKDFIKDFAPLSPKEWKINPNEWLSSVDIINVMKQYENAYKCFEFFGPSPIDFDSKKLHDKCVWDEICNLKIEDQLKRNKTKLGFIFNTDPHYKSGQHWISLFVNIKKGKIFFFDSAGNKIPNEIKRLVDRIIKQGKQLNKQINFVFDQNYPVEHQYGNTECGIYSIYFIVHMLEDKVTNYYLKNHILKDEYMQKFRKIYFNDNL